MTEEKDRLQKAFENLQDSHDETTDTAEDLKAKFDQMQTLQAEEMMKMNMAHQQSIEMLKQQMYTVKEELTQKANELPKTENEIVSKALSDLETTYSNIQKGLEKQLFEMKQMMDKREKDSQVFINHLFFCFVFFFDNFFFLLFANSHVRKFAKSKKKKKCTKCTKYEIHKTIQKNKKK